MEHVVFYTESSGGPEFRRVGDLEEAVRLVEILRNERGIADVSVHALTPVPVSFRTYYRVEVGGNDHPPAEEAVEVDAAASVEAASEVPAADLTADPEVPEPDVPELDVPELEVPALVAPELDVQAEPVVLAVESAAADVVVAFAADEAADAEVPAVEAAVPALEVVAFEVDGFGADFESDFEAEFESDFEVPSLEVPSLADETPAAPPLALLPPPVESGPVFDLDEPVDESDAPVEVDESGSEPADEVEALVSFDEPLVPLVRPEPEVERSLGYFAN